MEDYDETALNDSEHNDNHIFSASSGNSGRNKKFEDDNEEKADDGTNENVLYDSEDNYEQFSQLKLLLKRNFLKIMMNIYSQLGVTESFFLKMILKKHLMMLQMKMLYTNLKK